ncbi:DUF2062 domain-containing protein [uncultured Desulfosarcina sp.]|uniref:DUF2062 domain-containing protein n=1 Tax=uncultured Desulfosarcina sp. TaxID=218289 RepID=UPI003748C409
MWRKTDDRHQSSKNQGTPDEIALGFALGLLIGMTPFFGVHFVSSIMIASRRGWSSRR